MKTKLYILVVGLISVIGVFAFSTVAQAAILEDGKKFPQNDYVNTKLWWRDETHSECSQRDFAGVYMYKGLKTFDTKADCQRIDMPPVLNPPSTIPAKDVATSWPKRIILQIRDFFIYILVSVFPGFKNENDETTPTGVPAETRLPTEAGQFCGGFAANLPQNQCPVGYKCQLEDNYPDAGGTCVKSGLFGF